MYVEQVRAINNGMKATLTVNVTIEAAEYSRATLILDMTCDGLDGYKTRKSYKAESREVAEHFAPILARELLQNEKAFVGYLLGQKSPNNVPVDIPYEKRRKPQLVGSRQSHVVSIIGIVSTQTRPWSVDNREL
jgi:hypothetical protein